MHFRNEYKKKNILNLQNTIKKFDNFLVILFINISIFLYIWNKFGYIMW